MENEKILIITTVIYGICKKCSKYVGEDKTEWLHHQRGRCVPKRKCSYCSITDTFEVIEEHEGTHENYNLIKFTLPLKSIEDNYSKKIRKCQRCERPLTQYASDVCQFCGDK